MTYKRDTHLCSHGAFKSWYSVKVHENSDRHAFCLKFSFSRETWPRLAATHSVWQQQQSDSYSAPKVTHQQKEVWWWNNSENRKAPPNVISFHHTRFYINIVQAVSDTAEDEFWTAGRLQARCGWLPRDTWASPTAAWHQWNQVCAGWGHCQPGEFTSAAHASPVFITGEGWGY